MEELILNRKGLNPLPIHKLGSANTDLKYVHLPDAGDQLPLTLPKKNEVPFRASFQLYIFRVIRKKIEIS